MVEKTKILNIEIKDCKECPYYEKHRVTSWMTNTYCRYDKGLRTLYRLESKFDEDHKQLGSKIDSDCGLPDA